MASKELKMELLVALVRAHPGLDASDLAEHHGWNHQRYGKFRDAELAGKIVWRDGGWHAVEPTA